MLRLFAPFLPFATEEVWSWWRPGSVHTAPWPRRDEVLAACGPAVEDERGVRALEFAAQILGAIRKKKSEEQRPLKTPVRRATVRAAEDDLALLADVEQDLRAAGLIQQLDTIVAEALQVDVELVSPDPPAEERAL
jgi:valyl-tRNA synthetase